MVKLEIQNKLNNFLITHNPPNEECHIVYLMVEIRKLIEQETQNTYPILKFFCDWCVHTKKEVIFKEIKDIMQKIYEDILLFENKKISNNKIHNFANLKQMKKEMEQFLKNYNLPNFLFTTNFSEDKKFFDLFKNVLAEQPLINPHKNIISITFKNTELIGNPRIEIIYKNSLSNKNESLFLDM